MSEGGKFLLASVVAFVLLLVVSFTLAFSLGALGCKHRWSEVAEYQFPPSGCYVKVNNQWIPSRNVVKVLP